MPRPAPTRAAIVAAALLLAALTPAAARTRLHTPATRTTHGGAAASHAGIPQSTNIENLNDLSLRRARAGENTARPLAPPLAQ